MGIANSEVELPCKGHRSRDTEKTVMPTSHCLDKARHPLQFEWRISSLLESREFNS